MNEQLTQSIGFVRELVGAAGALQAFEERETEKRAALDSMFAGLTPELKSQIRSGLDLRVKKKGKIRSALKGLPLIGDSQMVDRVGSKELKDTEAAVADGYGLSSDDAELANQALSKLLELTSRAIELKDKLGNPLFDGPDAIEAEVFTPLVRQGVLPDNFVIGKYSEVQKLLDATFAGYRKRLEETVDEDRSDSAKATINAAGAGSAMDTLSGTFSRLSERITRVMDSVMSEDNRRRLGIAIDVASVGVSAVLLERNLGRWAPDENGDIRAVIMAERRLNPEDFLDTLSEERQRELGDDPDPDDVALALAQERREDRIESYMTEVVASLRLSGVSTEDIRKVVEAMSAAIEVTETDPARFTKEGISLTIDAAKEAIKTVKLGIDWYKIEDKLGKCRIVAQRVAATREGLKRANGAMARALKPHGPIIVNALENSLIRCIDAAAMLDAVSNKPDAEAVVKVFESALQRSLGTAAPREPASAQAAFDEGGRSVASAFTAAMDVKQLNASLRKQPDDIPEMLQRAVESAFTNGLTGELIRLWSDPAVAQGMFGRSVALDDNAALQELEMSQAETAAFERDLVLIDEAGELAADKKAIDKMIKEAERWQMLLGFAAGTAPLLAGMATSGLNLAALATETVTFSFLGTVVGPIKAVKLLAQLAIQIAEAAKRTKLLYDFMVSSRAAGKSASPLQSAIDGLLRNKIEQTVFHTIDDALTAVQIATNSIGAIPNEYAMAISMTTSMLASTTQKSVRVANKIYDEVQLRNAWKATREALDAPNNRELGLKALKLNPTLAVHALAWAGFEKQPVDPIARMTLKQLNLTEQSLAASGTEKKVRIYLETILFEDGKLLDPTKVDIRWAPKSVALSTRDWYVTVSRATKGATPKLRAGDDQAVTAAFKAIDRQNLDELQQQTQEVVKHTKELRELAQQAQESGQPNDQLEVTRVQINQQIVEIQTKINEWQEAVTAARDALGNYSPRTTDDAPHTEMAALVAEFQKLTAQRRNQLLDIEVLLGEADLGSD